eukprot:12143612-Alexandrium_andersonii.AAC.1
MQGVQASQGEEAAAATAAVTKLAQAARIDTEKLAQKIVAEGDGAESQPIQVDRAQAIIKA